MDDVAFAALYRDHVADVWRFARRRCPTADEADDAVAEAFAVAWRRRDDVPSGDAARLWLLGTTRLVLANQFRSTRRRTGLTGRLASVGRSAGPPDPGEVVTAEDPLLAALASLPVDQQDVLLLRAWDGLAVTEIAALLECTPNAASIRLTRARAALAAALGWKDLGASRTSGERAHASEGEPDDRT